MYTFHLRKGVKWHNHRAWKPTRDMNADDIIFMLERQGKEDNPYFKVTSSNHSYYNDMGMAKLIKSIQKVDDYTVRITLNKPEAPFLSNLAMEYAGVQSKEYADAMLKAGTPEKIDQEPIGTGPFYLVQYQKDAVIRYKAFPQFWGGKAKIDDLVFAITPDASVRWAKLQKGECHVMPYPESGRPRRDPQGPERASCSSSRASTSATSRTTRPRSRSTTCACARRSTWRSTRRPSSTPCTSPPASRRRTRSRRRSGRTTTRSRTIRSIRPPRRSCSPKRAIPNGFTTDLWAMPVQRPYNPNAKRIAELMQADLAKIGVTAEIKSFEWGEYRKRMQAGEHQMGMLGWTGDNGDPDNFLATLLGCDSAKTNGSNVAKFCYQPYEDLIQKAKTTTDQAERQKLYEQAQVIFKEQAPWFTIAHAVQLKPVRKEVIDFKLSPFGRHTFYGVDIKE